MKTEFTKITLISPKLGGNGFPLNCLNGFISDQSNYFNLFFTRIVPILYSET